MIEIIDVNKDTDNYNSLVEYLTNRGIPFSIKTQDHPKLVTLTLKVDYDSPRITPVIWAIIHKIPKDDFFRIIIE